MIYKRRLKKVDSFIFTWKFYYYCIELDLIKFVVALQQQHSMKIAHMDQIHSQALKRLELQLMEQQNGIDRDSP